MYGTEVEGWGGVMEKWRYKVGMEPTGVVVNCGSF